MIFGQNGSDKCIIGADLSDEYAQFSYLQGDLSVPQTLTQVAGEENYNIPMVMCKREGVNQWYFGREALNYAEQTGIEPLTGLLSLAQRGETVTSWGQEFDSRALLALFIKRCVSMVLSAAESDRIAGLMLTCHSMEQTEADFFAEVLAMAKLRADVISCQNHEESMYYYLLGQQPDLLEKNIMLLERQGRLLRVIMMHCNLMTTPKVLFSHSFDNEFPLFEEEQVEEIDQELAYRCRDFLEQHKPDAVYLIGEVFKEENIPETLAVLCSECRVFQGNNLYSKGACIAMKETSSLPSETGKKYVYLGKDKLKANVGMQVLRQGEDIYFPLLDAGNKWTESEKTVELYIKDQEEIEITALSLVGKENITDRIYLEGLPAGISRIQLYVCMETEEELVIQVSDMGFGEIRPATEMTWEKRIKL